MWAVGQAGFNNRIYFSLFQRVEKLGINVPTDLVSDGEYSLSDLQIPYLTVSPCGGERDLVCLPLPRRAVTLSD